MSRLRIYPWVIGVTMCSVLLINFSTPGVVDRAGKLKGTDFVQFYAAGTVVRDGRSDLLYDFDALQARIQAVAPGRSDTVYVPLQSPQTSLLFAPLAGYGYTLAFALWVGVIVSLYAVACGLTWRCCAALRRVPVPTIGWCAAFPALYSTVLHGQLSAVALLFVSAGLYALKHGRLTLAGLALGSLVFKPHWLAAAAAIFLAARAWRVVAGMAAGAAAQLLLTWMVFGRAATVQYVASLDSVRRLGHLLEPRPGNTLRGLFAAMLPSEAIAAPLALVAALAVVIAVARLWRSDAPFESRGAAIVLAMVLVSPHAFEYDLLLLAPALLLLANRMAENPVEQWNRGTIPLMLAVFFSPVLGALPPWLGLQFSVTAMVALVFVLCTRSPWSRDPERRTALSRDAVGTPAKLHLKATSA
jgi:hypothetical protein